MKYNDESDALCSKRKDQLIGFWSFILLNIIILGCAFFTSGEASYIFEEPVAIFLMPLFAGDYVFGAMLPWIINGLVILISLAVRPYFAVGYMASFAGLIVVSLLYVASCIVTISLFAGICPALLFPAWLILAGSQSRKLYRNACGNKSQIFKPRYRLEESSTAKPSQDEIRQRAEREWEEREPRENEL